MSDVWTAFVIVGVSVMGILIAAFVDSRRRP